MHKPILLGVEGEAKQIVEKYQIGEAFEPENEKEFIDKIGKILFTKNNYTAGHNRLVKDFDRSKLAENMLDFISNN
jgi:hypothetical protein